MAISYTSQEQHCSDDRERSECLDQRGWRTNGYSEIAGLQRRCVSEKWGVHGGLAESVIFLVRAKKCKNPE